jgi:hypothetical protein
MMQPKKKKKKCLNFFLEMTLPQTIKSWYLF